MKRCFIIGMVVAALAAFLCPAFADPEREYLVLIESEKEQDYADALARLADAGARAIHRFPSSGLIVRMDPARESALAFPPGISLHDDPIEPGDPKQGFTAKAAAIQAWNLLFRKSKSPLLAPWTEDAPLGQNELPDSFELDRTGLTAALSVAPDGPYGADSTETSEFFNGSVTVAVITLESNGSAENWTQTELTNVSAEIAQGLNNWIASEPNASLSFTYVFSNQVATSYEPIQGPSTNDVLWMQEAMIALGYNDSNVWVNLYDYANDLRNAYATNWAYSIFVVDDSGDADGLFSDGFCAFAYIGGPAMVMTYNNGAWGFTRMDMVLSHETAHVFWALDEYHPACTNYYPCTTPSGYLWVQNQNCNLNGTGGCAINQSCIMRDNNIANRCAYTRGQIGLTDTDGDNIPDVQDTFPETTLNPFSPDPAAMPLITYTGQATVTPLPRPGGAGNYISINTLSGVQFRVDAGSWMSAFPDDGLWDEPVENFNFTIGPLPLGNHTIQARATNNVSNTDATAAQDSLQVVQAPTASFTASPLTGLAPLTVNFTDATTGYVTGWSWSFGDGGTGSAQNPSHDYTTVGTFTVSLTADGGGVSNTATLPNLINVTCPAPAADFTASPTSGPAPLSVSFTDGSTAWAGCNITGWAWDFGDGQTAATQNPTHQYDTPGAYTVALTITNAGGVDTRTRTDLITVSKPDDDDDDEDDDHDDDNDDEDDDHENDDEATDDDDIADDDPGPEDPVKKDDDSGGDCCG